MKDKEFYEMQYSSGKLVNFISFPSLRRIFKKFDVNREDLALSLTNGGEVYLDVGCGNGSLAFKVRDNYETIYGIDISTFRIEEAKQKASKINRADIKFHFCTCNLNEKIEFSDEMFNEITCIAVLEHVFDPFYVVKEIYRVLKPGGIFIVEVPNMAYIRNRICLLFGKLPFTSSPFNWKDIGWDGGHLHYFTKEKLCELLICCGFHIQKITGCGLFGRLRRFYPALLTGDICIKAVKG